MKPILAFASAAIVSAACATAVFAQPGCAPRERVVSDLAERFGETRVAIGLTSNHMTLEVFSNLETDRWTVLITRPDGTSCLAASGHHLAIVANTDASQQN